MTEIYLFCVLPIFVKASHFYLILFAGCQLHSVYKKPAVQWTSSVHTYFSTRPSPYFFGVFLQFQIGVDTPQSAEAYKLNNICNAALTAANRPAAFPRTFTMTHRQSITAWIIPQDIRRAKEIFRYMVFCLGFSAHRQKICLCDIIRH